MSSKAVFVITMPDKAHAARLRKMRFAMRRAERHLPMHLPALFTLTDPERTPDPVALAKTLPAGSGLIYRHFGASDQRLIAQQLVSVSRQRHLVLLIANDPKLAFHVRAHGVHWPEAKLAEARKWLGAFEMMTAAAHSRPVLKRAAETGLDAALLSAIFPSKSKSAGAPLGALKLRQLSWQAGLPVYALGGVNSENAGQVANHSGLATIEGSVQVFRK